MCICIVSVYTAVEWAQQAIFYNSGQVCTAGSRVYVHEDLYDEFVKKATARAQAKNIGDPFEAKNEYGPVVNIPIYIDVIFVVIIPPPFEEVGVYCFAHVGRSVRPSVDKHCPINN